MEIAPLSPDEAQRLARLRITGILDTPPDPAFDAIVAAAARITGCPIALVSFVDEDRQWFKARVGLDATQTDRDAAFCAHAILGNDVLEVPDATADARFAGNPLVLGDPNIRFYAGAPIDLDGRKLGTLCVIDTTPRALSEADRTLIANLARTAADLLRSHQALTSLQAERQRLIDFARAAGDWAWECDANLRYTWVSPSVESVCGLSPSGLLGEVILGLGRHEAPDLRDRAHHEQLMAHFAQALAGRRAFSRGLVGLKTPRGYFYISCSVVPLYGDQGEFLGYRGIARDVSSEVRAQHLALAADQRLRTLTAQVPGALMQYEVAPDGQVQYHYVSEAAASLFERDAPFTGRAASTCLQAAAIVPQDRPAHQLRLESAARQLTPVHSQYRVAGADGTLRWLETFATPQRTEDGSVMWHSFTVDVTPSKTIEATLRESQQRFEMAANIAGIGISRLDLSTGQLALDQQACLLHGLASPQTFPALDDYLQQLHPDDRGRAQAELHKSIAEHARLETRWRIVRADGEPRLLEVIAQAIHDSQGQPVAIIANNRDITEAYSAEQLRREKEEAERASRAKSDFLSRVSHELRTPLNAILGFAQLMHLDDDGPLGAPQAARLTHITRASHHLLELINEVLDLGRIESGHWVLERQVIDWSAVMRNCLQLAQPMAQAAQVSLLAPSTEAVWVLGDLRAMQQVMLNLVSNAIKYNRPGGQVRVVFSRVDQEVQLSISDDGQGLSPDRLAQLFEPFNRLGAEKTRIEGSGLGLVIARGLVQGMGGQLEASSEPSHGATFRVRLPACEAPSAAEFSVAASPPSTPGLGTTAGSASGVGAQARRVLYIEDEPLNVLLMQGLLLKRPTWNLFTAATVAEGLHMADQAPPDLVLCDMNLPDGSGVDLLRQLRARHQTAQLPCIAVSADAMPEQIDAALAAGFDAYWTKPIEVAHVLAELDRWLARAPDRAQSGQH